MSAQVMRPGRRTTVPPGIDNGSSQATDQEIREAVSGLVSYFGTCSVDEAGKDGDPLRRGGLVPGWVGTSLVRAIQIDSSGQLILTRQVPDETDVLVWRPIAD